MEQVSMEDDVSARTPGCTTRQRVKFTEAEDEFGHDNDIIVHAINSSTFNVHLGFLQIGHRYEVKFLLNIGNVSSPLAVRSLDPPNLNLRLLEIHPITIENPSAVGQYVVTLELFAHREKLMKEQLLLEACDATLQHYSIILHARVLGKGKGTPFLKSGIRCIGVEMEEDSEYSDWQGFD